MLQNGILHVKFWTFWFFVLWQWEPLWKGPENEVSPRGKVGAFFLVNKYGIENLQEKYQLDKKIFPQTPVFELLRPDYNSMALKLGTVMKQHLMNIFVQKKFLFQRILFCWRQRFHRTYRPIGLRHKLLKWEYIFTGMCYDFENLHGDCPNYILCIQIKIYPKWRKYLMT